jgi:chemotaxis response regulator CheB
VTGSVLLSEVTDALTTHLPRGFGAPIVVCQHIAPGFADGLAKWLAASTGLRVHEGADGRPLVKGEVFMAPAHAHVLVTPGGTSRLDGGPPGGRLQAGVVFGMPREAIAACGVEKVLPLAPIAPQLVRWVP